MHPPFRSLTAVLSATFLTALFAILPFQALAATDSIVLGMGCFWGAEKRLSEIPGVLDVESGYAGGDAERTSYREVLNLEKRIQRGKSDERNHAEVIKVTFDPEQVSLERVLIGFWENHNPTQGDRQGNDVGSNYRSAIYFNSEAQRAVALETRDAYQQALSAAGLGPITTEIAPLRHYNRAETYHQDYLVKNPDGYCGLGGTQVAYPGAAAGPADQAARTQPSPRLDAKALNAERQLIVFEAEDCPFCQQFRTEVLDGWSSEVPVISTLNPRPPEGWTLEKDLFATPTMVLFEDGKEISRYTGYKGDKERFWQWLGFQILTPEQQRIAFEQGTERAFTGSHLDEKRPGVFVDPITGAPLFRSDTKFESKSGWPSFFNPVEGALTYHEDNAYGMRRTEVRSASSGIHLGHVFDDGPPPTGKRYCINGNVLSFVPDAD
ncbi:peptide methionine sulfoxide reductase [Lamprobacter modestohalophilus]|uniref:Peptide methionine sulfoxide reductase MsrA n=1 Tax=Lamprobacter modestohalophilus TaxID=1064514 RepID=A0A9X0WBJ5_9GAMM|nr:peptide-methionine (S)-S-oxide reductase MsrA [Lamprobacter modestohalophilus]MBK1620392.1 peptide methionine sulfoxide reductase [Lamprobacter modestohalophilus]